MSRKNIQESFDMFTDSEGVSTGDMSASQTSAVTSVKNQDKASVFIEWSGSSPVGVVTVEARNKKGSAGPDSDWQTLEFGSAINISGNTGVHTLIFNEMPFTDIRIVYTRTSGTGTIHAFIGSKTVGS